MCLGTVKGGFLGILAIFSSCNLGNFLCLNDNPSQILSFIKKDLLIMMLMTPCVNFV